MWRIICTTVGQGSVGSVVVARSSRGGDAFLKHEMPIHVVMSSCQSVHMSEAGIVPKWLNVGSQKQYGMIAQGRKFSYAKK